MRRPLSLFTLLALAVVLPTAASRAATTRACSDPCLQSARAEAKDCAAGSSDAFRTALDGCLERDHECVDACRWDRQECRSGTSIDAELAMCQADLDVAKRECDRFSRPRTRIVCIYRAQIAGFQCRRRAFGGLRQDLAQCEAQFKACAGACAPGGPAGGVSACKSEAKSASRSELAGCRNTFQVTASACIDKDLTCTQGCTTTRETCNAPTQAALTAALASCAAQAQTALVACATANPGGGPALQDCITAAKANALTCSDAATQAAAAASAPCAKAYLSCVHQCPSAPPPSAAFSPASPGHSLSSGCTGGRP